MLQSVRDQGRLLTDEDKEPELLQLFFRIEQSMCNGEDTE
jgi:hypothetical protein